MADAKFLTFEGLDGSGKSTHLRRAAEWLRARGDEVLVTHEPGGTPLGNAIRGLFLDARWGRMDGKVEALLVFASRRQHLLELVEPTLDSGVHVLCDRFTDSSLAYQGGGRGLGADWILELDGLATCGRRPDATLLFDLQPEAAMQRGQKNDRKGGDGPDRLDVEGLSFYRAVRDTYLDLVAAEPGRFRVVDSEGEREETWRQVEVVLEDLFR
ncbi:MAG: dTMP kinase [Thermoanaerobaculia bacterium]|nr:dTMP kinase [Thermoanaerobaculia bacterium]